MDRNDEELLSVERPVAGVGVGQKVAGGMLRGAGLLMYFGGALFAMSLLMMILAQWSDSRAAFLDPWWGTVLIGLTALGAMVLGSVMGVFGMMTGGALRTITGERFIQWALAAVLRDLSLGLALLLVFGAVSGALIFGELRVLVLLVPGAVLGLLGWAGQRWMNRMMEMR